MKIRTHVLILLLAFCLSCNIKDEKSENTKGITEIQHRFDKTKWRAKQELDYPFRDAMLDDLMSDQKLKGLRRDKLLNMLGKPDREDSSYLFYMVKQTRIKFWPLHTKTLVIKLAADSSVNWVKIHQ